MPYCRLLESNLFLLLFAASLAAPRADFAAPQKIQLHPVRASSLDLEVGGDLAGVQPGGTGYVAFDQLRALEQVSFTSFQDPNLPKNAKIQGVALTTIAAALGAPREDLVVATCTDKYQAHYTSAYLAAHSPVLVLLIDGKRSPNWANKAMGPYVVADRSFLPSSVGRGPREQQQIPWGVDRLDFRSQKQVFGAIAPQGPEADAAAVQNGYALARQNCFRCHNMGGEGGQKAQISWPAIAAIATAAPDFFSSYVRHPEALYKNTKMEGSPDYDDVAMKALIAYFATFTAGASRAARAGPR